MHVGTNNEFSGRDIGRFGEQLQAAKWRDGRLVWRWKVLEFDRPDPLDAATTLARGHLALQLAVQPALESRPHRSPKTSNRFFAALSLAVWLASKTYAENVKTPGTSHHGLIEPKEEEKFDEEILLLRSQT